MVEGGILLKYLSSFPRVKRTKFGGVFFGKGTGVVYLYGNSFPRLLHKYRAGFVLAILGSHEFLKREIYLQAIYK